MRGRCVPCDREYVDLLTHLETAHPDLFGGATFARRADGSPVVVSAETRGRVFHVEELRELAAAALPHWDDASFEVWTSNDGDGETAVHRFMAGLHPAAVLLLLDQTSKP